MVIQAGIPPPKMLSHRSNINIFILIPPLSRHCSCFVSSSYETDIMANLVPPRDHALACLLRDRMGDASGARRSMFLVVLSSKRDG